MGKTRIAAAVLGLVFGAASLSRAAQPWTSARTDHLRVVGPVGQTRVREIVAELAYVHEVFAQRTPLGGKPAPTVTVFALTETSFLFKAPIEVDERLGGFPRVTWQAATILLNADTEAPWREALRRDYALAWLEAHAPFPHWLAEGLSAYLSTVSIPHEGKIWIGEHCQTYLHARGLEPKSGPIDQVLEGPARGGPKEQSRFAGKSLALVRWLIHARGQSLEDLFALGRRAVEVGGPAALTERGIPSGTLDREVRAWQPTHDCPRLVVEAVPEPGDDAFVVETVSPDEQPLLRGEMWLAADRPRNALEAFLPILRGRPDDARALRGTADAYFFLGRLLEAAKIHDRLQALGLDEGPWVLFQRALVRALAALVDEDPARGVAMLARADLDAQAFRRDVPDFPCGREVEALTVWGGAQGARRSLDLLTDIECDLWGSVLKAVQHARLGEADAAVEAAAALDRDDLRFLLGMAKRMGPMLRQMETADSAPELTAQADRLALFTGRVKELLAAARR